MPTDLASTRVTVMGLGRFGGGVGVTRWLVSQGADVLVTDVQPAAKLTEPLAEIQDLVDRGEARLRLGEHNVSDFTTCDMLVANPAVPKPWDNRFIRSAMAAGIPVTTEIRLLTERINRTRTIGVTGSAGKSTTSSMVHHVLVKAGVRAHLGGNFGGSLLNELHHIRNDDWIVLELSSAMLYWLSEGVGGSSQSKIQNPKSKIDGWSPHIAALTNINPNHIDWHGSFEHYRESKLNIFKFQHADMGDRTITGDAIEANVPVVPLKIPGRHNQFNARMAMKIVHEAIALETPITSKLLADFPGLPHRLQLVAEHDRMRFFNDSKSTTPEATVLAVEAFDEPERIHLIAGGYDKGSDLTSIAQLRKTIAGLYCIGTTGATLAQAVACGFARNCDTLYVAIDCAMERMRPGDILLLSPGCASWDQFINYEQRGEAFVRHINECFQGARAQ